MGDKIFYTEEVLARMQMTQTTVVVMATNAYIDSRRFAVTNDDFIKKIQAKGVYDALMHVAFLLGVQDQVNLETSKYLMDVPNESPNKR